MRIKNRKILQWLVFMFPGLFLLVLLKIKFSPQPTYYYLNRVNGVLDYFQFAFFLLSSIWSFRIAVDFIQSKRWLLGPAFLFIAFAFLFVAGEEIDWGQYIFNWKMSDYFKIHNTEQEMNIHNLDLIEPLLHYMYILVGLYGILGWLVRKVKKKVTRSWIEWFIPDWYTSSYFIPLLLIYIYFAVGVYAYNHHSNVFPIGPVIEWRDQEPCELMMAVGFFIFLVVKRMRQKEQFKIINMEDTVYGVHLQGTEAHDGRPAEGHCQGH